MATPRKLKVLIGFPSYGGNGGISSEVPDIRQWMCEVAIKTAGDERIEAIETETIGDTPITMVRNRFVEIAKKRGADVLVMVDSDMGPNYHRDVMPVPGWKDFWDTSFDYLYDHYEKGPVCIGAPYCGPPEVKENVYVFLWRKNRNTRGSTFLEQYTREEAYYQSGIKEVAALPTGLIMYDMRCFDLIDSPYFYYEWSDKSESEKASTEDVSNTRDISLAGVAQLGYNPVLCNWDSWACHYKPWPVGKPEIASASDFAEDLKAAVAGGRHRLERDIELIADDWINNIKGADQEVADPVEEPLADEEPDEDPQVEYAPFERGLYGYRLQGYAHQTPNTHLNKLRDWLRSAYDRKRFTDCDDRFRVLEIGSWVGESAVAMASVDPRVEVTCIDPWTGNQTDHTGTHDTDLAFSLFLSNIAQPDLDIQWKRMTSEDYRSEIPYSTGYDFIFLDAEHTYAAVHDDLIRWLPFLRDRGSIVIHDYATKQFPGVTKACDDIFNDVHHEVWTDGLGGMICVEREDIRHSTYTELVI